VNKKTVTIATATIAAMLAGVMLTGCHNTSAASDTTGGGTISGNTASGNTMAGDPAAAQTTTAALTAPAKSAEALDGAGSCNQWPGVGTLQGATSPLRLAAGNTESYGYEDPSDSMAVNIALTAVANELSQLPADWAEAIRNQVIFPGYSTDPSQMYTAASNAQSLASQISQLCYTP
jgi:hypothetical protein